MSHEHFSPVLSFEVFFLIETESTCGWHSVGFESWSDAFAFYQAIPFQKELWHGDFQYDSDILKRLFPLNRFKKNY